MIINRAAIKGNAKISLKHTSPNPVLVTLVYLIIGAILYILSSAIANKGLLGAFKGYLEGGYPLEEVLEMLPYAAWGKISTAGLLLTWAISFITAIVNAGYVIYTLNVSRGLPASYGNLLDGFAIFLRVIALYLLEFIFMSLWSLLFIIPGIVASYRYRQAIYLLIENPQLSALDCIRRSKQMMMGRKGELFVLDLSFLGWDLLCGIPVAGWVLLLWIRPYISVTYANYYNALAAMGYGNPPGWGGPGGYGPGGQDGYGNPPGWGGPGGYGPGGQDGYGNPPGWGGPGNDGQPQRRPEQDPWEIDRD